LGKKIECPLSFGWKSDLVKEDSTRVLDNRNETHPNRVNVVNQGDALDLDETNVCEGGVYNPKLPSKQPSPSLILDKKAENISVKRSKRKPVTRTKDFLWGI
jgi:hypothetical protein